MTQSIALKRDALELNIVNRRNERRVISALCREVEGSQVPDRRSEADYFDM